MQDTLPKIIVILGPTASGKTDLSLVLAKKYNGEVVSADSRQVYKKMDIGTAKPSGIWNNKGGCLVDGVPHHLIDIIEPDEDFSLAEYKKQAIGFINSILEKGKLPIIVGGTGLYVWALVDNLDIPEVRPDAILRKELEQKPLEELVQMLKDIDANSAEKIDLKNPRRIIRALEVAKASGKSFFNQRTKSEPLFNALQIGLDVPREELCRRIDARVDAQIQAGLVEEVKRLVEEGCGWELPSMSSIGYRQIGQYLQDKTSLPEAIEILKKDTRNYAKRQMTWFKKDKRIQWIKNSREAEELVKNFLSSDSLHLP